MKYIVIIFIGLLFSGCTFKSSHERFIVEMDTLIQYKNYQKYKTKFHEISDKYLVKKTFDEHNNTIYHFNWTDALNNCPCKYYVIVNPQGIMIDWGFNDCDKEKCCINLG